MDTHITPTTAVTVNDILSRYEREYVPHELAPQTQKDYARRIVSLRQLWGSREAATLKPKDFADYLHAEGRRRGRINRVRTLAVLSGAFSEAVSSYYILDRNPLRDVKRPKNPPRDRLVTTEEFQAVKAIAPHRLKIAMDLAVLTGQRQGDILDFRWKNIQELPAPMKDEITGELITHELVIRQSKTGKRLAIGITKDFDAVLDRCWLLPNRGEYLITRQMGGRFSSQGFRALWQRAQNRYCHRGGTRYTFHDLRALAATRCPTPEIAMRLLGHSNISMTLRVYRRGIERVAALTLQ